MAKAKPKTVIGAILGSTIGLLLALTISNVFEKSGLYDKPLWIQVLMIPIIIFVGYLLYRFGIAKKWWH